MFARAGPSGRAFKGTVPMAFSRATVFGGSGFIGRQIVKRLAAEGTVVRVAVRDPEGALFLKPMGAVGQVVPAYADLRDRASVEAAVRDVDIVVNATSQYVASRKSSFEKMFVEGGRNVAEAATAAGVQRLVHMSGVGTTKDSDSAYVRARAEGDEAVTAAFPGVSFLKPSVVFGPGDHFTTLFARMAQWAPALPVIGGATKVQPVYVGDVADAAMAVLHDPATAGKSFELGGPRVYSYRRIIEMIMAETRLNRLLIPTPIWVARIMAALSSPLPNPPITRDMIILLQEDNLVAEDAAGLDALGIAPKLLEALLPTYMDAYRKGGRFKDPRHA